MKKQILIRCLIGAPIGLTISTFITIISSFIFGNGNFYPVVPELAAKCGTELNAVLLQTFCSLLYGSAWAGASIIWEKEDWSLFKQTILHLIIGSLATFPIAYFMYWIEHNALGIFLYFGIFFLIYFIIWFLQYSIIKNRICQMNQKIRENNKNL